MSPKTNQIYPTATRSPPPTPSPTAPPASSAPTAPPSPSPTPSPAAVPSTSPRPPKSASPATTYESDLITGDGLLQVGSGSSPFELWATAKGLDGSPGKEITPAADPDRDGRSNLAEFAFDGNPLGGSDQGKVFVFTADSSDADTEKELVQTVAVRKTAPAFSGTPSPAASADGVTYQIHPPKGASPQHRAQPDNS